MICQSTNYEPYVPEPETFDHTPSEESASGSSSEPDALKWEYEMNETLGEPDFGKANMTAHMW